MKNMLKHNFINRNKDKTIVLIHGYLSSSKFWEPFLPYLDDFNILTLDLPGHGESSNISAENTLKGFASEVMDVINENIKGKFILCGQSLGGYIVSELALRQPPQLEKIIILNSPNNPKLHDELNLFLALQGKTIDVKEYQGKDNDEIVATMESIITRIFEFLDIHFDISKYNIAENKGLMEIIFNIAHFNIEQNLKEVKISTLILSSDNDKSQDIESYRKLEETKQNIEIKVIENSKHHKFADYNKLCKIISDFSK